MIETIIQFIIYIPLFVLVILNYLLLRKMQEYQDEIEYLKSICEQAIKISEQTEKKINEHINKEKLKREKAYFQGYAKGKAQNTKGN